MPKFKIKFGWAKANHWAMPLPLNNKILIISGSSGWPKMPNCGTWKVPFRGKFGPYNEGRRIVPPFSIQVSFILDLYQCYKTYFVGNSSNFGYEYKLELEFFHLVSFFLEIAMF